jgi:hypothetical protein
MKLRAPDGCCAASHAGKIIEISEDGSAEVEDDLHPVFVTHGFTPWESAGSTRSSAATKHGQLVLPAMGKTMGMTQASDPKGSCTKLTPLEAPTLREERKDTRPRPAVPHAGVDDISTLNRRALFAFLREKGVSVSLPITNDELRAAARRASDS